MYQKQQKRLITIIDLIKECLQDENFTTDEKMKFINMECDLLQMLSVL